MIAKKFFNEIHRILKKKRPVFLVEHMRDTANFLAFGPGFFHFYPRSPMAAPGQNNASLT